jgi:hypothetical protein
MYKFIITCMISSFFDTHTHSLRRVLAGIIVTF